jgi:hypothetical protein
MVIGLAITRVKCFHFGNISRLNGQMAVLKDFWFSGIRDKNF